MRKLLLACCCLISLYSFAQGSSKTKLKQYDSGKSSLL